MRGVSRFVVILFLVAAFAGCIAGEKATKNESAGSPRRIAPARDPTSAEFKPHVVVAVIDSGINPYHSEFEELYDTSDPADYIPGYPKDVTVLQLSEFKSPRGTNREVADSAIWNATQSRQLYRVEGTKIVGLISFANGASGLPGGGHGMMTSSRAVGNTISAGGPTVRIVHVRPITIESIQWAASQPWIDMISISAGITGTQPQLNPTGSPGMIAYHDASHKKPFFASSGNGLGNAGVLGFPTWLRGASGVPDVISVGANDNGKLAVWHNWQPYIVGDGCGNPAGSDNSADAKNMGGGGTSSATPYSAGVGAKILLEARRLLGDTHVGVRYVEQPIKSFSSWRSGYDGDARIVLVQGKNANISKGPLADGILTAEEFKDILYHTARWDGSEEPSDGNACQLAAAGTVPPGPLPRDAVAQFQGYGEVTIATAEAAIKVMKGEADNPSRPMDDIWYNQFRMFRQQTMPR